MVATGDAAGNIFIWQAADVRKTDYAKAIASAVRQLNDDQTPDNKKRAKKTPATRLIDDGDSATQLVSIQSQRQSSDIGRLRAHNDIIESIRFSDDGQRLLSASDDYTLKLWDLRSQTLDKDFARTWWLGHRCRLRTWFDRQNHFRITGCHDPQLGCVQRTLVTFRC